MRELQHRWMAHTQAVVTHHLLAVTMELAVTGLVVALRAVATLVGVHPMELTQALQSLAALIVQMAALAGKEIR